MRALPLYNYEYDTNFLPVAHAFKSLIAAVDMVLFFAPEYNRSVSGELQNAIDWGSRPYRINSFMHKPSAIIGTSPGAISTASAQKHLRGIFAACASSQIITPEAYTYTTPWDTIRAAWVDSVAFAPNPSPYYASRTPAITPLPPLLQATWCCSFRFERRPPCRQDLTASE